MESAFSISDVSPTMPITLYARARESLSKFPVITDPKAIANPSVSLNNIPERKVDITRINGHILKE